jgi:hypothetical protein
MHDESITPGPIDLSRYARQGQRTSMPKAERKSRRRLSPVDEARSQRKRAVQVHLPLGLHTTYHGPNRTLDGREVKVVGHSQTGDVYVELARPWRRRVISPFDDRPIACSPFCLLTRYLHFEQLVALRNAGIEFFVREVEFPPARPGVR